MAFGGYNRNGTRNSFEFPNFFQNSSIDSGFSSLKSRNIAEIKNISENERSNIQNKNLRRFHEFEDLDLGNTENSDESDDKTSSSFGNADSVTDMSIQSFQQTIPSHLLIVALLEHICNLHDKDKGNSKELFRVLCQQLETMRLIPSFAVLDEFQSIRDKYRSALNDLMHFAITTTQKQKSMETIERPLPWYSYQGSTRRKADEFIHTPSRYEEEFEEIDQLGEGGFGSVFEVVNKLDKKRYAVKKIVMAQVDPVECLKNLREVKVLANLDHMNIVRYHFAWLEYSIVKKKKQPLLKHFNESHDSSLPWLHSNRYIRAISHESAVSSVSFDNEASISNMSDSVLFEDSMSTGYMRMDHSYRSISTAKKEADFDVRFEHEATRSHARLLVKGHFGEYCSRLHGSRERHTVARMQFQRAIASGQVVNFDQSHRQAVLKNLPSRNIVLQDDLSTIEIVMYIQMELCSSTLKHWISDRNDNISKHGGQVDWSCNSRIFEQLLYGVQYIHNQGLMHRDLKPCNVFINQKRSSGDIGVKIGDFGLARDSLPNNRTFEGIGAKFYSNLNSNAGNFVTKGIGTCTYAAPEQLVTNTYTFKADIYSLGIILFELFCPFATGMERHALLKDLRQSALPYGLMERWPEMAHLIKMMTKINPDERPDTKSILNMPCFQNKDKIISMLRHELFMKSKEIEELKKALSKKDSEVLTS